jgi:hypothetical protein
VNCKKGDIAYVTHSMAGNEGKVVTCIRIVTAEEAGVRDFMLDATRGPLWEIDCLMRCVNPKTKTYLGHWPFIYDDQLRPLKGGSGEDETFKWAGKPGEITNGTRTNSPTISCPSKQE